MPTNIPFQPVQFNLPDELTNPEIFSQLITEDDKLNFQVEVDTGSNLVVSGLGNYAQTPPGTWDTSGGLHKILGADGRIYQTILTVGEYYKVTINVLRLNTSGQVEVQLGNTTVGLITFTGEYTLWGQCNDNPNFSIFADDSTDVVIEDSVGVHRVNNDIHVAAIADNTPPQVVLEQITSIVDSPDFIKNGIAVFQDLDLVEDSIYDCFRLLVASQGEVEWSENWTNPSGWTFQQLVVANDRLEGINIPSIGEAEKVISLPNDSYIILSLNIIGLSNASYVVQLQDENNKIIYGSELKTSPGPFMDIVYLPPQTTNNFKFFIRVFPSNDTNTFVADDFFAYALDNVLISNQFKKIDSNNGTILVEASNDSDCFGFAFDNNFQFNLRVKSDLQMYLPEDEADIYKDSKGQKKLYYAESEETQQFAFDSVPIYIIRALQKMRLLNTLLLEGAEKVVNDNNFEVDYDSEKMGTGSFVVTDKVQDYFNYL